MDEIRLAVCHPDEPGLASIAARLRGAIVEPCADPAAFRPTSGVTNAVLLVRHPNDWRAEVERLLRAGVHVQLVAEPCPNLATIEGLSAQAREAGVQFVVVNPDRYLPSRQLIRKQLSGPLGEPGLIRFHRWKPVDQLVMPEELLRDLDVTLWLAGRRPNRIFAVEQNPASSGWYVQIHLGFPNGGMALLDIAQLLPPGDGYQSLSVIAANGAAYADDHQNVQLLFRGDRPLAVCTQERAGQLAAVAQESVDGLRTGRDLTTPSARAWRDVFAVYEAVQQSVASGRAIELEDR
jgi:predicted dehydrogenase